MKKVSGVVIALFLLSMALISVPVGAHTEEDPLVVDLLAGQTIDVGDVLVWNDGDYLYVKYVTTDGWLLTETHLAIASALSGIPKTKTGNPIPGKFTYFAYHDPPVDEYTYPIDLTWDPDTELYIAAHAVVRHDYTLLLVSDAGNTLADGNPAFDAYEPNTWYPNMPYTESEPSLWDTTITSSHNFELSGADWIWNTYFVNDDDSTHGYSGEIVEFTRTFDIPGTPTAGALWITCDNGYEAKLNGQFIGSAQLSGEWRTSDLHEAYVHTYGWQIAESYNVLGALQAGQNALAITGVNEYLNTDDGDPFLGDEGKNPAGLIYELNINYYKQETAWGDGDDFPGANWATYFTYTVQGWTWYLYGEGLWVEEGLTPPAIELTSIYGPYEYQGYVYPASFSGVVFIFHGDEPLLFGDLYQLSFDYYVNEGNAYGGSPRFTIFFETGEVMYIYLGNPPSFIGGLPVGTWTPTGNFIGDTVPRFHIDWLGWYLTDYAGALGLAGDKAIDAICLDLDSGWSGNDQDMLVDNIAINDFILTSQ